LCKSPGSILTTSISLAHPSSESFVAKPEIRHAGIVDVTFGKNGRPVGQSLWMHNWRCQLRRRSSRKDPLCEVYTEVTLLAYCAVSDSNPEVGLRFYEHSIR
jgi:hypothetical protein